MTDNIPPIPPAPQHQPQPGTGQPEQPAYALPAGYAQPTAYPQQFGAPTPVPYGHQGPQAPQYGPPAQYVPGHWAPAGPQLPKSSGFRVAAGIIAIVLGGFLFLASSPLAWYALEYGFPSYAIVVAILGFVAAFGSLTSGIVLLVKHRGRRRAAPVSVLIFAAFPLVLGVAGAMSEVAYSALLIYSAVFSIPLIIVMGIGLAKEKRFFASRTLSLPGGRRPVL